MKIKKGVWVLIVLLIIAVAYLIDTVSSKISQGEFEDKIIVIPIKGTISVDAQSSLLGVSKGAYSSKIIEQIQKAEDDKTVKAVIFEINSPGGSAVASKEIGDAISRMKKPSVAWIRELGASGGYWVASECDKIVASPLSITGSIGVISSYLEFSGLMEEYGVKYEKLTAGEFKDMGNPYRNLTSIERELLQKKINMIYEYFIKEVSTNRKMDYDKVKRLATGEFYLGEEAKELGLVDVLGGDIEAVNEAKNLANIKKAKIIRYEDKKTIIDLLGGLNQEAFYSMGRGIGAELKTTDNLMSLNV